MSYLLFPVQKVLLEYIIKLGDCIFFSKITLEGDINNSTLNDTEKELVKNLIDNNKDFFKLEGVPAFLLLDSSYSEEDFLREPYLVECAFSMANRALDYVRILECPFKKPDFLLGIPGIVGSRKYMFVISEKYELSIYESSNSFFYSMQPGIGLDIGSKEWTDEELYQALYADRADEVYNKYRNILAESCEALRIRDINRCFVYLFSKVDGMGHCNSYSFKENKIRILSCLSDSQQEFDMLSNRFYFYSKIIRTEVVHKGEDILHFTTLENANKINQNLFLLIVEFCKVVIGTGIDNYSDLDTYFEQESKKFVYNKPEETDVVEIPRIEYSKTTYVAPMEGLDISIPMKRGNIIILPCCEKYSRGEYYTNYVKRDTGQVYDRTLDVFSISDLEYIVHITHYRYVAEMMENCPILIGLNLPRLMEDCYSSPILRDIMVDNICNELDKCLYYDMLVDGGSVNSGVLPPKSGISDSIRGVYEFIEDAEDLELALIPGRVYEEYNIPEESYRCVSEEQEEIYSILYSDDTNYIRLVCKSVLEGVCESYYCIDNTTRISYLFDLIDRLYPFTTGGDKLAKRIFTILSNNINDYVMAKQDFEQIRLKYRNPILHGGKNIIEIEKSELEIQKLESYLRNIIIDYCVELRSMNISTWEELDNAYKAKQKAMGLVR